MTVAFDPPATASSAGGAHPTGVERLIGLLRGQMFQAFVLKVASFGLLFLMNVVLARTLGPHGYGVIAYALATVSMASVLVGLGMSTSVMRFLPEYLESGAWGCIRGVLLGMGGITVAASLVGSALLVAGAFLLPAGGGMRASLLCSAAFLPFATVGLWRGKAVRGLGGLSGSLLPEELLLPAGVVACLLVLRPTSVLAAATVYVVCFAVVIALGMVWLHRHVPAAARAATPEYHPREWIRVSVPMVLGSLMQTGLNRTDVLLLGAFVGAEATGLYNAASRTAFLCSFVLRVVNTVVAPRIARAHYGGRPEQVRKIVTQGMLLSAGGALPVIVALMIWPDRVMGLFGDAFHGAALLLLVLAAGQFFNAATGPVGHALLMTGNERGYARIQAVVTVLTVVAYAVAIPRWGALGAAVATTGATIILNVSLFWVAWQVMLAPGGSSSSPIAAPPVLSGSEP